MKIVVLDGYTLNPGDLSWKGLESLGSCTIYDRTPSAQVKEHLREADIALTNKVVLDEEVFNESPLLKYVGVLATGYNIVDIEAAKKRGIPVTNVPEYSSASVAQLAYALLLELVHHVGAHSNSVREGNWSKSIDFCYWNSPLVELEGLTLGVIGAGRIGKRVLALGQAFGMNTQFHDPSQSGSTPLETVLSTSDVVSLHCPLTPTNPGLINSKSLGLMKPTAFLLNTSRGGLIVDQDLADALNNGRLAGAGLDVLTTEPPSSSNPLLTAKNCIITPHIAWATFAARKRLLDIVTKNIQAFLDGKPQNVVNL